METNKKYFNRLAGGAMLLAGAMAFAACSSDEDFADAVNPGAGATGETVKTQFSIAVPGAASANKRLGSGIVQADGVTFRGMTGIRLVPFIASGSPLSVDGNSVLTLGRIALGDIANNGLQTNGDYKVYYDVEVPENTNYFVFYGEALSGTDATAKVNGSLLPSYENGGWPATTATLSSIHFDLEQIYKDQSITDARNALTAMLTDIANNVATAGGTNWSAATGDLKNYRDRLLDMEAGSAASIKQALQDLCISMKSDKVDEGSTTGMKEAILNKVGEYYTVGQDGTLTDLSTSSVYAYKDFPRNLGLPDGSMRIDWQTAGQESKFVPVEPGGSGNLLQQTAYKDYVYPAALFYTQQTTIKTADQQMTDGNGAYTGQTDWESVMNMNGWGTSGAVSPFTQSIALVEPVNYAVASFNLYARFATNGEVSYIYDNGANYTPAGATQPVGQKAVSIPADGFPLTGILIGDQRQVNWDFTVNASGDSKTIYDASVDGAAVKQESTVANPTAYTLALETEEGTATTGGEKTVRFALEMENTSGEAFCGVDGIVPAGGRFYLVGTLKTETSGADPVLKVFEQDHKTIARVTINSLKSAYNCIPDLRSPKLELGLAVDLQWQQGLEANVTID